MGLEALQTCGRNSSLLRALFRQKQIDTTGAGEKIDRAGAAVAAETLDLAPSFELPALRVLALLPVAGDQQCLSAAHSPYLECFCFGASIICA